MGAVLNNQIFISKKKLWCLNKWIKIGVPIPVMGNCESRQIPGYTRSLSHNEIGARK